MTIQNIIEKFDVEFDAMTYFDDDGNLGGSDAAKEKVKNFLQSSLTELLDEIKGEFEFKLGRAVLRKASGNVCYDQAIREGIDIINSHK